MAKRSKKKAKSTKRAKVGKKAKPAKKSRAAKKTKTAKKRKTVAKTKVVKKTRPSKKKVKTPKPKKPRLDDFGNDNCAGERERADAAKARVDSLFELLNNPETTEDQKPQILENINQAETDFEAAQRALDMCLASFPIAIDNGPSS